MGLYSLGVGSLPFCLTQIFGNITEKVTKNAAYYRQLHGCTKKKKVNNSFNSYTSFNPDLS
jgi:hypothetical protein